MHFVHHRWICKPLASNTAQQCLWSPSDKNVICHFSPNVKDCVPLIRNDGKLPETRSFYSLLRCCNSVQVKMRIPAFDIFHPSHCQGAWQWSVLQVSLSVENLEWMWNCHSVTYILIKQLFIAVISIYCSNWDTAINCLKRKYTEGN